MRRRTLLALTAAGAAGGLAGCIGDGGGAASDGETPTDDPGATESPTDTPEATDSPTDAPGRTDTPTDDHDPGDTPTDPSGPTDTPTASPGGSPAVTATEFAVTDRSSGTGRSEATISRAGRTVSVDGTARGNNGCSTAELESAAFDGAELRVAVRTYEDREEDEACTQATVDIHYEADVDYEGHLDRVVVTHDGTVVAEKDY